MKFLRNSKNLYAVLLASLAIATLIQPHPVEAGLSSYIPSLSSFNPFRLIGWGRGSGGNSTVAGISSASSNISRSDEQPSLSLGTNQTFAIGKKSNATGVNEAAPVDTKNTTTKPMPSSKSPTTTPNSTPKSVDQKSSLRALLTTQKPVILDRPSSKPVTGRFQIRKNGRAFEVQQPPVPINLTTVNVPPKADYSTAFDNDDRDSSTRSSRKPE